jgi:DNA-binding NarL/FixJ family response regulator
VGRPRTTEPALPQHDGVQLTRRQAEILALLAEGAHHGRDRRAPELSPRTVEAHLRTLYRKIDVRSRTTAAHYAVEHGWTTARHAP